jgi:hypothetical protein
MSLNAQAIMTPGGIADQLSRGFSGVAQAMQEARQSDREHKLRLAELEARRLEREDQRNWSVADRIAAQDAAAKSEGFGNADERASYYGLKRAKEDTTAAEKLKRELEDRDRELAKESGLSLGYSGYTPQTFQGPLRPGEDIGLAKGAMEFALNKAKIDNYAESPGQGSTAKAQLHAIGNRITELEANMLYFAPGAKNADPVKYAALAAERDLYSALFRKGASQSVGESLDTLSTDMTDEDWLK